MKLEQAKLKALSGDERHEVDAALRQLAAVVEANSLVRFAPHPKQRDFLGSTDKTKVFFVGNRAGKTTCGLIDVLIQAVDAHVLPERLRPYKRWEPPYYCRIVTPDLGGTQEGVLFPKLREWCPQLLGGSWSSAYNKVRRVLSFQNGSRIEFMSNEMALDKFGGAALHGVLHDEEPLEAIRNECAARLIDFGGSCSA